jgi:2-desacetyl-2-hydroxyethyl bacteriochlorophyllide A dehydrogenase
MAQTMTAVRLHGPGDLRLEEINVPEPGPGEVLVKVHRCGICGTDLHIAKGNFPAPNLPLVLGHEFSGTVAELGAGVAGPATGSRVVVDINTACGHCYFCRRGQKLFCPTVAQLGVHTAGGLAEYVVAPAANLHVLPDSLSLDTATYVEPLACAVHGQDRIGVASGDTVLVIGGGPMGLAHIALSRLKGAARVVVSELDGERKKRAEKMGADVVIDPSEADLGDALNDLTQGVGPDVVIEAVGSIPTYESAVAVVRRGGKILAYGAPPATADMKLRPFDIYAKELTIVGSYAGTYDTWPRAIELLAGGRFDPNLIVDSVRPLDEAVQAIEGLERDRSTVKVHIQA